MIANLEKGVINLIDLQIELDEIPLLCQFLATKTAVKCLQTLIISKLSVTSDSRTKYRLDTFSALNTSGQKLFRAVLSFIARSVALTCVIIDSIKMGAEMISVFAQSLSLTKSSNSFFHSILRMIFITCLF